MKTCGWNIFDVPIATTVSIKELLVHYGEITLSYIKAKEEIINDVNDKKEQEDDQLYI